MTVAELIEKLQKLPQDSEIYHYNYSCCEGEDYKEPVIYNGGNSHGQFYYITNY